MRKHADHGQRQDSAVDPIYSAGSHRTTKKKLALLLAAPLLLACGGSTGADGGGGDDDATARIERACSEISETLQSCGLPPIGRNCLAGLVDGVFTPTSRCAQAGVAFASCFEQLPCSEVEPDLFGLACLAQGEDIDELCD